MSEVFALGGGKWHIRGTGVRFPRIIANMAGKHPKSVFYLPISPNNYYAHHFDWSLPNLSFSNLQFHRFSKPSFSRVLLSYLLENFSYCLNKIFLSAGSISWQFSQSPWAWTICFLPLRRYHLYILKLLLWDFFACSSLDQNFQTLHLFLLNHVLQSSGHYFCCFLLDFDWFLVVLKTAHRTPAENLNKLQRAESYFVCPSGYIVDFCVTCGSFRFLHSGRTVF